MYQCYTVHYSLGNAEYFDLGSHARRRLNGICSGQLALTCLFWIFIALRSFKKSPLILVFLSLNYK